MSLKMLQFLGQTHLVLTFPKSYHFSKQYFERSPEQLKRVEKALERVVGKPIRVKFDRQEESTSGTGDRAKAALPIPERPA